MDQAEFPRRKAQLGRRGNRIIRDLAGVQVQDLTLALQHSQQELAGLARFVIVREIQVLRIRKHNITSQKHGKAHPI